MTNFKIINRRIPGFSIHPAKLHSKTDYNSFYELMPLNLYTILRGTFDLSYDVIMKKPTIFHCR